MPRDYMRGLIIFGKELSDVELSEEDKDNKHDGTIERLLHDVIRGFDKIDAEDFVERSLRRAREGTFWSRAFLRPGQRKVRLLFTLP